MTQTDTEVIAHLVDHHYDGDLLEAVERTLPRLRGAYAIAVFCRDEPHRVVAARHGSPLVLGVGGAPGANENFVASDAMALAGVTDQIVYLEEGDVVDLQLGKYWIVHADANGAYRRVERTVRTVVAHTGAAELGPYRHYMQKEIFEQPKAIADTLDAVPGISPELFGDGAYRVFKDVDQVLILACGTSYYSGLVAKYWLEGIARIPTSVEVASEYRYRDSVPNPKHAGRHHLAERRDGRHARRAQARALARHGAHADDLQRGDERDGARVRDGLRDARRRRDRRRLDQGLHDPARRPVPARRSRWRRCAAISTTPPKPRHLKALRHLPVAVQSVLALEPQVIAWSEEFARKENALFLGRGMHYPVALEGALKLKEISYIHAEAYPAGELKHGPLALVTAQMPVVAIAPNDALLRKAREQPAGSARARRRAVRVRRCRHADRIGRRRARDPHARALRRCSRRSCTSCRCSCWRITPRWRAAPTSTSRATWRRA